MTSDQFNWRKWAIAAAVIIFSIFTYQSYNSYNSSLIRHGGLAELYFQTLGQAIRAEAELLIVEATKSACESLDSPRVSCTHSLQDVTFHWTWELYPDLENGNSPNIQVLKGKIQTRLMQMIDGQASIFQYYYPRARMSVDVSVVDSGSLGKPSIRVSLKCNT